MQRKSLTALVQPDLPELSPIVGHALPQAEVTTARTHAVDLKGAPAMSDTRNTLLDARGFAFVLLTILALLCPSARGQTPLDKGHRILLERGLQIQSLVFTGSSTGSGTFDLDVFKAANFTTVIRTWRGENELLGPAPGYPWARWMDRTIIGDYIEPVFSPSSELDYASSLVSVQVLDEQNLNDPAVLADTKAWVDATRDSLPNTIIYTNQSTARHLTDASLQSYMSEVKPDMLCFDTYAFTNDGPAGGSPTLLYSDMQRYRRWAMHGNDQSATRPIPYGMYLQTYEDVTGYFPYRAPSDSEMRLNQFAAWTFGMKWVSAFTYNWNGGATLFYNSDERTPRPAYYQIAETNRQSLNLGDTLVRLLVTDIKFNPGRHPNSNPFDSNGTVNDMPSDLSRGSAAAGWGNPFIKDISVDNISSKNRQQTITGNVALDGDVVLSLHKLLDESFDGPQWNNEVYFMILNGLSDRDALASETRQRITVSFDFASSGITSLQRLSRDTGQVEIVPLVHDVGSLYHLDLTLDGGTADLFKFNTGAPFVVPEPSGLAPLGLLSVALIRKWRN